MRPVFSRGVGQVVMRRDIVRRKRQCAFVERNRRRDAALTAIARRRRFREAAQQPDLDV